MGNYWCENYNIRIEKDGEVLNKKYWELIQGAAKKPGQTYWAKILLSFDKLARTTMSSDGKDL